MRPSGAVVTIPGVTMPDCERACRNPRGGIIQLPMSLSPGATLGPYTITAELGHGGMGVVDTAQDPRLKRQVAIKLLTADLTRDETAKQRFLQETPPAFAHAHLVGRQCGPRD